MTRIDQLATRLFPRLALAAFLLLPAVAFAQQADAEGAKDHPMVPRIPGYYIDDYQAREFDKFDFPVAEDKEQAVEGRYWQITYWVKDGARTNSALEISRNYRNAFAAKGGRAVYVDSDAIHSTFVLRQTGSELWVHVDVSNGGEVYELDIVEKAVMDQQISLSAAELAKALNETGTVALRNILFDTGQATIKPESAAQLGAVVELLKADPSLKLEVQGHTDNVGAKAANLALSERRAAAVRDYLVKTGGIDAGRLTSAGFGDTKPVAPNTTDAGRAENRRVELVKK
jgi:outer membrane protein OmpA-like peptidoglycan-associated protein